MRAHVQVRAGGWSARNFSARPRAVHNDLEQLRPRGVDLPACARDAPAYGCRARLVALTLLAFAWFLLGCACTTVLGRWLVRRTPAAHAPIVVPAVPDVAVGVSAELATLASGIEGTAQLLCERIHDPRLAALRADQLCCAVRRLRALSETIKVAVGPVRVQCEALHFDDVLLAMQHELEVAWCGRLQIAIDTATALPMLHTDGRALRQALLLLADVLTGKEPSAGRLSVRSRTKLNERAQAVEIELSVEVDSEQPATSEPHAHIALGLRAATNLLDALGAEWRMTHVPGRDATVWIAMPAASDAQSQPPAAPPPRIPSASASAHEFGGAIVCDRDPTVRFMVGQELERTGRQVFLCGDRAAARALWRATPERFELMIVEAHGTHAPGDELVAEALASNPHLRALLLGGTEIPELVAASSGPEPRVAVVAQPFGMFELRDALSTLGAGAPAA